MDFCTTSNAPATEDTVCLYLLSHVASSGAQARARVGRLDVAAILAGERPPGRDAVVKRFLSGYYRTHALGPSAELFEPLYTGDVRAVIDATLAPTWQQLRDQAFLVTMNASGLRWEEMKRLVWHDVSLRARHVELQVSLRKGRYGPRKQTIVLAASTSTAASPVRALQRLHSATPLDPGRPVFSTRGGSLKSARLRSIAASIDAQRRGPQRLLEPVLTTAEVGARSRILLAPLPIAQRDRLLVLLGFLAGMTNQEAQQLRVGDVRKTRDGLLLALPRRRHSPTAVHARHRSPYCPVQAWDAWLRILKQQSQADPACFVFVGCDPYLPNLRRAPLRIDSISLTLAGRAHQAGLQGRFTYLSLKEGMIRSALRLEVPHHDIAAHVGHRTVAGIVDRGHDESAFAHNILPLLGL